MIGRTELRAVRALYGVLSCALASAGCDVVFGLASPVGIDASPGGVDADVGGLRFGPPQPLAELNTDANEERPSLTDDMLELLFARGGELYRSHRASRNEPWGEPALVAELSTIAEEASPCVSADGLTLHFSRRSGSQWDILVTTRAAREASWGMAVALPASQTIPTGVNTTTGSEHCGWYASTGLVLVHASNILHGDSEVFRATRPSSGEPFTSQPLDALNSAGAEDHAAWATPDERILVFGSNRTGSMFVIHEAFREASTYRIVDHPELGPSATSPWISSDAATIVYARYTGTSWDLYVATR